MKLLTVFLTCICFALFSQISHGTIYSVTDLGILSNYNNGRTTAGGLNDLGQVSGTSALNEDDYHGYLWDNNDMTDLGDLSGGYDRSVALAVNNLGQVTGWSSTKFNGGNHAFLWDNGDMIDLGISLGPPHDNSQGKDINDLGQIVGRMAASTILDHAFLWQNDTLTDLGTLPDAARSVSEARAINELGQIVGGSMSASLGYRAVTWIDGTISDLGALSESTTSSIALAINDFGQIVGQSRFQGSSNINHAVMWYNGNITDLGVLPGMVKSGAQGINNLGQVVGSSGKEFDSNAFLWDATNGMHDINDLVDESGQGWHLRYALQINDSGQIVGGGTNPDGYERTFLLTPEIPEPSTFILALIAVLALLPLRWR